MNAHRYFVLHKPVNMVSQFVSPDPVRLLGDLQYPFPEGTHAIGRLDAHSEGLLLLTTNKRVTNLLFLGEVPHEREYLVLVGGIVSADTLHLLRNGIPIRIKGGEDYITSPCDVSVIARPEWLPKGKSEEREVPQTWLSITLTEGKYHQVRKMVREAGHRCKRLIRVRIENLELGNLLPGEVQEVDESLFFDQLKIKNWKKADGLTPTPLVIIP